MFYEGQKVVCVNTGKLHGFLAPLELKEGSIYIVKQHLNLCCMSLLDVGLTTNMGKISCTCGNSFWKPNPTACLVYSERFAPLDEWEAMQELVNELTQPELITT